DGPSYIGLIPIPATDLGRTEEIVLDQDGVLTALQGGGTIKEQLRINSYNYKSSVPLALTSDQEEVIDNAYGGFIVEMGDSTEYTSFAEFQVSVHRAELATSWDASARKLNLRYVNGATAIDLSYLPAYPGTWGYTPPLDELFPERRVNGGHTYPAADLERDSTLSQQGRTGRLEKNGAVLESTPGLVSYLLTEPRSATYVGYNPLPDLADFRLSIPGGKRIVANGKIGLARVLIQISTDTVEVDFAMKDEQKSEPGLASEFLLFGFATPPKVICNGVQLQSLDTRTVNGEMAYLIEAFKPRHR
ncbi:MAG TPA: hypothetical protein VE954_31100, partial [Oligoflexus sp.]|uniref:hypothetical protein n=1 Tax=Oligoflexus sp. TaxID=1971216 RepID=UPI002D3921C3